jgi:hypothetical protein
MQNAAIDYSIGICEPDIVAIEEFREAFQPEFSHTFVSIYDNIARHGEATLGHRMYRCKFAKNVPEKRPVKPHGKPQKTAWQRL